MRLRAASFAAKTQTSASSRLRLVAAFRCFLLAVQGAAVAATASKNEPVRAQNARRVFLIDCIGAITSALMLGLVLPKFERYFGMPVIILHSLALVAICLAFFSGSCMLIRHRRWQITMRLVALANIIYCLTSAILLVRFWGYLTPLGMAYFVSEKIIVLGLACFEFRTAKSAA
jgi:hypothetical protein